MGLLIQQKRNSMKQKNNIKTIKKQITGEAIELKIDEYSETYGEILLSMNRELSEMKIKYIK